MGGPLATLPMGVLPEAVLTASRGSFSYVFTEAVPDFRGAHVKKADKAVYNDASVNHTTRT